MTLLTVPWCRAYNYGTNSTIYIYTYKYTTPTIGSLVFSDIVHNDSWSWYLARFLKKKKRQPEFGPSRPKSGPKWGFLPFYWVWIICDHYNHMMYTMIACDNLTFSWSKTHAKNLGGPKFGPNRPISCQN